LKEKGKCEHHKRGRLDECNGAAVSSLLLMFLGGQDLTVTASIY
jgi:hypothetical protein